MWYMHKPVLHQTASDTLDDRLGQFMAGDFEISLSDYDFHLLSPCALQQYPLLPCWSFLTLNETLVIFLRRNPTWTCLLLGGYGNHMKLAWWLHETTTRWFGLQVGRNHVAELASSAKWYCCHHGKGLHFLRLLLSAEEIHKYQGPGLILLNLSITWAVTHL